MKCFRLFLFIAIFGGTWRLVKPTCVWESAFGFSLNCAFKKSGLFRVRNLGGVKAHIGLGFTVGDELMFKESISNVENNRRRSTDASKLEAQLIEAQQKLQKGKSINSSKSVRSPQATMDMATIPPFKPIPPAAERPNVVPKTKIPSGVNYQTAMSNSISRVAHIDGKTSGNKLSSTNFAIRTLPAPNNSIQALLAAHNVTEEALEAALAQRAAKPAKSAKSTTFRPPPQQISKFSSSYGKVMNAPKEYYPVGYDKNFDDNFASRVDLPDTSFYCGDQKHFPGLYADEDLGCMVFHVCALTDDGLIMKSFLCPESTLFDQSVLKCNWWFYVDCKNSKKLYDSNIPVSKSYQLMKALTFFSAYKKDSSAAPKSNDKD